MKNTFQKGIAVMAIAMLFTACNNDDSVINKVTGTGNLGVEFDNAYAGNDLILNADNTATSNNEILKISKVKYIISNVVLYDLYGTAYIYPKAESYFIVDETNATSHVLELENIPAGNYIKIKFGIGVDQAQYDQGENNQGDFYSTAQNAGMLNDWTTGYKFLSFGGSFTAPGQSDIFDVTVGKTASDYNYKEVTLNLPTQALVRTTITPEIHVVADLSKIIDGTNKIKLSEGSDISTGTKVSLIAANLASVFSVAHVHND
jgi:hypothetical protein